MGEAKRMKQKQHYKRLNKVIGLCLRFVLIMVLYALLVFAADNFDNPWNFDWTATSSFAPTRCEGLVFSLNESATGTYRIQNATTEHDDNVFTTARLYTYVEGGIPDAGVHLCSTSNSSEDATYGDVFDFGGNSSCPVLNTTQRYLICADGNTGTLTRDEAFSYPIVHPLITIHHGASHEEGNESAQANAFGLIGFEDLTTPAPTAEPNVTINVVNLVNHSNITTFNVTLVNGSLSRSYQVTDGLLVVTNLSLHNSSIFNITIHALDHISGFWPDFNLSNVTTPHTLNSSQGWANITAQTIITGQDIVNISAYNNAAVNHSSTSSTLLISTIPLNLGSNNVLVTQKSYYGRNYTINLTSIGSNTTLGAILSDSLVTVNMTNINGNAVNTFNATLSNSTYSFSNLSNTTNGSIFFWLEKNVTFDIFGAAQDFLNVSSNFTSHTNATTIDLQTRNINTINFTVLYEPNRLAIQNGTKTLDIISTDTALNITLTGTNNTVLQTELPAGPYEIRYRQDGFQERRKFVDFTSTQGVGDVELYLLDDENSTRVDFTITDQFGDQLENATIKAQRYYLDTNGFIEVEACRTNFVGECTMHLKQFNVFYRFIVEFDEEQVFQSSSTEIEDDPESFSFQVNTGTPTLENLQIINDVIVTLNFSNTTSPNFFTYTFSDTNGLITTGCLTVTKKSLGGDELINSSCVTASSGTIQISINESDTSTFLAQGFLTDEDLETFEVISIYKTLDVRYQTFGLFGVFWMIGIIMVLVGLAASDAINHPAAALVFMVLGLLASFVTGFSYGLLSGAMLIIIMAGIVIFKLTRS